MHHFWAKWHVSLAAFCGVGLPGGTCGVRQKCEEYGSCESKTRAVVMLIMRAGGNNHDRKKTCAELL